MLRRAASEGIGTAFLLMAIVGSGIMGERLAGGNVALVLIANSVATGAALSALIMAFAPISGAHFNPAVTLAEALSGHLAWREVPGYVAFQLAGAYVGVGTAHLMFGLPVFFWSRQPRAGAPLVFSEFVATFGLVSVVSSCERYRPASLPLAVGGYITAAYWFTASTSFANPAVTLARVASDTFAGIRPSDAPGFVIAQLTGAVAAYLFFRLIEPVPGDRTSEERAYDEEEGSHPVHG